MGRPPKSNGRRAPHNTVATAQQRRKRSSGSGYGSHKPQARLDRRALNSRPLSQADRHPSSPHSPPPSHSRWQRFINWFDHLLNGTSDLYGPIILPNDRDHPSSTTVTTALQSAASAHPHQPPTKKYNKLERAIDPWKRKAHLLAQIADPDNDPRAALKLLFALFRRKARGEYAMGRAGTFPWSPLVFVRPVTMVWLCGEWKGSNREEREEGMGRESGRDGERFVAERMMRGQSECGHRTIGLR